VCAGASKAGAQASLACSASSACPPAYASAPRPRMTSRHSFTHLQVTHSHTCRSLGIAALQGRLAGTPHCQPRDRAPGACAGLGVAAAEPRPGPGRAVAWRRGGRGGGKRGAGGAAAAAAQGLQVRAVLVTVGVRVWARERAALGAG